MKREKIENFNKGQRILSVIYRLESTLELLNSKNCKPLQIKMNYLKDTKQDSFVVIGKQDYILKEAIDTIAYFDDFNFNTKEFEVDDIIYFLKYLINKKKKELKRL